MPPMAHVSNGSFMERVSNLANFSLNTVLQGIAMVFQCARMKYAVVNAKLPCITSLPHF